MTKKNFLFLVLLVMGTLLFGIGMCMCLLPEWNAFGPGAVVTAVGAAVCMIAALLRWAMAGKPRARVNRKLAGKIAYCTTAALVLGAGMAMIMAFDGLMLPGMIAGVAGILLALGIIPVCKGLK